MSWCFAIVFLTTCVIIPAKREIVNSFFGIFCKKIPAGEM